MGKDICPICNIKGAKVPTETVHNLLKPGIELKGDDYYICTDVNCSVGYFDNNVKEIINHQDLITSIWYKVGANPKIICYCLNIREEEIIITAIETGIKKREHMSYYLRNTIGGDCCLYNNPMGVCCEKAFNETVEKAMILKEAIDNKDESHPLYEKYKNLQPDSIYVSPDEIIPQKKSCEGSCCGDSCK